MSLLLGRVEQSWQTPLPQGAAKTTLRRPRAHCSEASRWRRLGTMFRFHKRRGTPACRLAGGSAVEVIEVMWNICRWRASQNAVATGVEHPSWALAVTGSRSSGGPASRRAGYINTVHELEGHGTGAFKTQPCRQSKNNLRKTAQSKRTCLWHLSPVMAKGALQCRQMV